MRKTGAVFPEARPEDVFGRLHWEGERKSLADMDAGVLAEARRRHAAAFPAGTPKAAGAPEPDARRGKDKT